MRRNGRVLVAAALVAMVLWWLRGGGADDPSAQARARGPAPEDTYRFTPGRGVELPAQQGLLAAIAGHVRDPDGQPIAGARVCAWAQSREAQAADLWAPTCGETERDGAYHLDGLLPSRYAIEASAPGRIPARYTPAGADSQPLVTAPAGGEARDIDLVLWPGGVELRGRVHDASGGEIEGAVVRTGGSTDFSGPDGSFVLYVRPGQHGVEVDAEGYASGGAWVHAPGQTVDLLLVPEAVLVGQVVDAEDGLPVAGARVIASRNSRRSTTTDASGRFRISRLKPGSYKPWVEGEAHTGMAEAQVQLGIGETSPPVTIRVRRATSVRGRIVIPGGGSCPSGGLWLSEPNTHRWASGGVEADGEVVALGVLPGRYEVSVDCLGYVAEDSYEPLTVADAPITDLVWKVLPARMIRGRVVDQRGRPDPAARVTARPQVGDDPRARLTTIGVPVGPDGGFKIRGVAPGQRYSLEVSPGPGRSVPRPVLVEVPDDRDLEDVVLTLPAGMEVRGRVVDGEGRPVARASITLRGEQEVSGQETGDDGRFVLSDVPPGRYRAIATLDHVPLVRPGQRPDDQPGVAFEVRPGSSAEVEIVVEGRVGRITGRVVDSAGGPVADAFLDWSREGPGGRTAMGLLTARQPLLSDGDGRFELTGLAPGTYSLKATRRGAGGSGRIERVELGSDVVITIADVGEISGSVRLAGGGAPEWLRVTASEVGGRAYAGDDFLRTGGRFTLVGVEPGTYTVRVESGEGDAEATVTLAEGEARRDVEFVLQPRVTVRGRLVDLETGAPVAGMRIRIEAAAGMLGSGGIERRDVSDAQGRFEVEGAPTGKVYLSVRPANHDNNHAEYPATSIPLLLEGTGSVEIAAIELIRRRTTAEAGDLGFALVPSPGASDPLTTRLIVGSVRPGGPAAAAGLQVGDEIVAVDGHAVTGALSHRFRVLTQIPAGQTLQLTVARGETLTLTADPPA